VVEIHSMQRRPISEPAVILLIGAVQFINILDFVMVMPLAPYYSDVLGIGSARNGWIAGSYTAAASIAGLVGGYFLDRFDRRKALAVSMLGLVLSTAAGGFARGMHSLMLARVCAGLFGGPATSVAMAIVADLIPPERRGKAMGAVMSALSAAQVIGVPLSLLAAEHFGWRTPFFSVAAMGVWVVLGSIFFLPPVRDHLDKGPRPAHPVGSLELLGRRDVQLSYLMTALVMMSGFMLVPNIPAFVVHNLGYPRDHLLSLYAVGGVASFGTLLLAGRQVDKLGPFKVGTAGAILGVVFTYIGFVHYPDGFPIHGLFIGFMVAMGMRNVSYNTLTSKVPEIAVRARFMSLQSSISHLSSSLASAVLAPMFLNDLSDGSLVGMDLVAQISMALALTVPPMLFIVDRRVRARAAAAVPALAGAPALAAQGSSDH
jgi:predicted MFS family arabinose efflux permease